MLLNIGIEIIVLLFSWYMFLAKNLTSFGIHYLINHLIPFFQHVSNSRVELGNAFLCYSCFKENKEVWSECYHFSWALTILGITTPSGLLYFFHSIWWMNFMSSLIFFYLEAIYFLSGTFENKKCTSLTFFFFYLKVGLQCQTCLLCNLSGSTREITNPLKAEWCAVIFMGWATALLWFPLFGNILKKGENNEEIYDWNC